MDDNSILSNHTRKVRKSLLIASVIGYSISKIGLTIKKVSLFGSEFSITNHEAIPFILIIITTYLLITFISYSLSDYSSHYRKGKRDYIEQIVSGSMQSRDALLHSLSLLEKEIINLEKKIKGMNYIPPDGRIEIEKEIEKKKFEQQKLNNILRFHETNRKSLFDYFTFAKFRLVMELIIPILAGIITIVFLIFYTNITQIDGKELKGSSASTINKSENIIENKR
ncbi:MAG: hypothetical protein VST71_10725 [Nitrospirota bacterium]|nr:hypothetical protein [Nitrospirota bacterium]